MTSQIPRKLLPKVKKLGDIYLSAVRNSLDGGYCPRCGYIRPCVSSTLCRARKREVEKVREAIGEDCPEDSVLWQITANGGEDLLPPEHKEKMIELLAIGDKNG